MSALPPKADIRAAYVSVKLFALGSFPRSQFLNRPEYPIPGGQPVKVTLFQHLVGLSVVI